VSGLAPGRLGRAREKARWYARRLAAMSPEEVALHARRAAGYAVDDLLWRTAPPLWRRAWEPPDARLLGRVPALGSPLGVLTRERVALVARELPDARDRILALADARLERRVRLLGYPEVVLGTDDFAAVDPFSGRRWPDRHGRRIDYRRDTPGDPKWVWELLRRQEVPLLAEAWLLSGEARYAEEALRLLRLACAEPAGRGVGWANAFEPGIRALSLAVAFDALRAYPGTTAADARLAARGLWQHGRWIVRDRSAHSSANNHLVGELAGLLAVALLVPELRDAPAWQALALDGLAREAARQVLPDGAGAEQAFAYTLFLLDLLLASTALLEARGLEAPAPVRDALARAAGALTLLVDDGETDPAFGDADDGRALVLDARDGRDARGVAASLAACLGEAACARLAGGPDETSLVLFGAAGLERQRGAGPASAPGSGVLPAAGIVVLRHEGSRLLFDAGPLGYLSLAAHGHADALQVLLSHGGVELVSDPGTGSYFGDPELRARLRGTAAHATVAVDGADQAEQGGAFLWLAHPETLLRVADPAGGAAVGEHRGYRRLADPVTHRRAVAAVGDGAFVVYDRLDAAAAHGVSLAWPLGPGLRAVEAPGGVDATAPDGTGLAIRVSAGVPVTRRLEPAPWSRRLEHVEETSRLVVEAAATGPVELVTLLAVGAPPAAGDVGLERADDGATLVSAVVGGRERRVRFDLDGPQPVGAGARERSPEGAR
jgi:hypothetical protein